MGDGGRALLLGGACVLGALVLYAGALGHPIFGDDHLAITTNPTVAQPSATGLRTLWVSDYWRGVAPDGTPSEMSPDRNLYRPVTVASFWLTSWVGGLAPTGFRLGNVLAHALAALLVALLAGLLGWRRGSVVAAGFVLVHPAATDVVNRIVGRADALAVVGVAGFLCVQRWSAVDRQGWTWPRTLAALIAAVVALGAKESGVVLVPLALLLAWMSAARSGTHAWRGTLALGVVTALYGVGRALAVELPRYATSTWDLGGNPVWGTGFAERVPVTCALAWDYARFMVWPTPLIAFDVPSRLPGWSDAEVWLGAVLLLGLTAALVAAVARRHPLAVPVAWWLLAFLIVGQLLVPIGAFREVRFAYALVAGTGLALAWASERVWARTGPERWLVPVVALVGLALAVPAIVQRNADYRDLRSLLEADVRQRPSSPAALIRLANIHDQAGRHDEALRTFERVLVLAPTSAQARYELGDYYGRRGRAADARVLHEQAVALNPAHHHSWLALGTMALNARDLVAAETYLTRAAEAAPDDPFVLYNLAVLEDARGNRAGAITRLEALVARRPDFSLATRGLAQLRAASGHHSSRR